LRGRLDAWREQEKISMPDVQLIEGGVFVDDRGEVRFVNDFGFQGVKRFYIVKNHRPGYVRAWHGHRNEGKYFSVVSGAAVVCGVEVDDWKSPSRDLVVRRFVLSEARPAVLHVPPGYANGMMALLPDSKVLVFSTATLQESLQDDIRFEPRYWNPWDVPER
jgi:dTDP-4-dehydrorhamnose 3,5-epimerase